MRWIYAATAFAVGFVAASGGAATAQQAHIEYPWCAVYGGDFGGTNCGFSTIEQCRLTVSGIGGSCEPNQFYQPQQTRVPKRKRAAQH
jgi:hypothetical protein